MKTIHKHGNPPYQTALLHGGPGALGGMGTVAEELSKQSGILELIQTQKSVQGQVDELKEQLKAAATFPVTLVGWSWGAWLGYLFASENPGLVRKLILVSSGAFESKYNVGFEENRLNKLAPEERKKAERLIALLNSGKGDNVIFSKMGRLMTKADAYAYDFDEPPVDVDLSIFETVWPEAAALRKSNKLIGYAQNISCPVVAIHGEYDSHPVEAIEISLSENLKDFRMIRLKKCGHTPWREKFARDMFYKVLQQEL